MRSFQRSLMGVMVFGVVSGWLAGCSSNTSARLAIRPTAVERTETVVASEHVRFSDASESRSNPLVHPAVDASIGPDPAFVGASYASAAPVLAAPAVGLTQDEVVVWTKSGASDDVIIDRIERSDSVFRLTAGDEMQLRRQGVSEDVICAMKETARR